MMNVIRRSQIIGLMTMDGSTATKCDRIEEVWLDEEGRVVYLAGTQGYTPLEQISVVGPDAVLTYSSSLFEPPKDLLHLNRMRVSLPKSDPLGWVEDFLFDWETGDIAAYILGGDIAEPFGGRAVLFPDDIETIDAETIVIKEEARNHLQSEAEGLKGFLSEKSHQVKQLVQKMVIRLRDSIHPQDEPEVVHVKIREVSDELAATEKHDLDILTEATEFLQDKWQSLQQSISHNNQRMRSALDSAWKKLTQC
ncbi:PRC-barrel domain-containing protein [Pleurocapsales cyanobacterium LEGE 10410]|nr:PRC-barrel domain-containing protein [Pleurocapsales cyanobacterium LEGE 10410]